MAYLLDLLPKNTTEYDSFACTTEFENPWYPGYFLLREINWVNSKVSSLSMLYIINHRHYTYSSSQVSVLLESPYWSIKGGDRSTQMVGMVNTSGARTITLKAASQPPTTCSCDIHVLMRSGCECGAFNKEKGL